MQRYLRTGGATKVLTRHVPMHRQMKGLSIPMHPSVNACQYIKTEGSANISSGFTSQT